MRPPRTHRNFSRLDFVAGMSSSMDIVDDQDVGYIAVDDEEMSNTVGSQGTNAEIQKDLGGWLESDDIEDF